MKKGAGCRNSRIRNPGKRKVKAVLTAIYWEIYVPWQKFCHFIRWPHRQHTQDISETGFRIDAIQPACSDKTIQQCSTYTTMIAAEEDVVFIAKTDRSQRALSCVIIRLCKAIIVVVAQRIPLVQSISERLANRYFSTTLRFSPSTTHAGMPAVVYSGIAWLPVVCCRETTYFLFNRVQLADTFQGFLCCRRLSAYIDVVDFAPRVGPACSFYQQATFTLCAEQPVVTCEDICLQHTIAIEALPVFPLPDIPGGLAAHFVERALHLSQ